MFMKIDKYKMELSQKSVESPICWFHSTGVHLIIETKFS